MLMDGNQFWIGTAWDEEEAEERCFHDEEPGSLVRYTLERWAGKKWVEVYRNKAISIY
jgi:hypothetical protein